MFKITKGEKHLQTQRGLRCTIKTQEQDISHAVQMQTLCHFTHCHVLNSPSSNL